MIITFFAQVVYSEEDVSRVHTLSLNEARQLFPHGVSSKLATEVLTFTHCKVFFSESIHIQLHVGYVSVLNLEIINLLHVGVIFSHFRWKLLVTAVGY